jgi:type I restriction enzyme R subunit
MSKLLDALIELRRKGVVSYKEYLEKIAQLTKEATMPGGGAGGYPASVKTVAQRALYNNLGKDEGLALAVDAAITGNRQDGWKSNTMKTKKVRIAIRETLAKAAAQPVAVNAANQETAQGDYPVEVLTDQILELAKHQNDY